jgi:hypothetical protein
MIGAVAKVFGSHLLRHRPHPLLALDLPLG